MKRRIIAALMCLCMLIGLLPVSVLAAHSESPEHLFSFEYSDGGIEGKLNIIVQDESGKQLDQITVNDYQKGLASTNTIRLLNDQYTIVNLTSSDGGSMTRLKIEGQWCTFAFIFAGDEKTLVMTVREFDGPEVDEEIDTGAIIEYRIYDAQLLKMLYAAGYTDVDIDTDIETIEFEFVRDYTGSSDWEFLYKLPVANSLGYHYASLSNIAGNGNPYNIKQLTVTFNNGVKAEIPASDLLYHKAGDLLYEIKANADNAKDLCAVVFYAQPGVLVEYRPYAIRFVEKNESFQSAGIDMPEVPDYGAEYIFTNWAYDTEGERPFLKSDVIVGDTDVYARRTSSSLGGSEIHVMNRTDSLVNRFLELYNAQQNTEKTKDDIDFSSVQITVYGKDGAHTNPDYDNGVTQCEWKNDNEYFFVVNYNTPYGIPALTNTHIPHDEISKIVMTAKVNGQDAQVEMSVGDGAGELSVNLNVQEYIIELVVNDAPDAPDDEDLTGDPDDPTDLGILGNVKIKCTNPDATHNNKEKEYKAIVGSYTIGPVIATADGGYKCDVTVAAEKYVAQYNTNLGVSHTAQNPTAKKITLTWNDDTNEWIAPSGALPVEFSVNCSQDKYTLTYNAGSGTFSNGQDTYVVDDIPATEDYLLGSELGFNNPSHTEENDKAVVLAGWSITQPTEIYSKESLEVPVLTKTIDINSTTATNKAITVYAIWGYDANGNGTPDYKEETEDAYFYVLKPSVTDATGTAPQNFFYVGQGSIFDKTNDVTDFTGNGVRKHISKLPDATATGLGQIGADDIASKVGDKFSKVLWYRVTTAKGANSNHSGSPIVGSDTSTRHVDGLLKPENGKYGMIFMYDGGAVYYVTIDVNSKISADALAAANNAALTAAGKNDNQWNVVWKNADSIEADVANTTGTAGQILFFYADFAKKTATYTLSYNANAQQDGTVDNMPSNPTTRYSSGHVETLDSRVPSHSDVNGQKVVFIGWSKTKSDKIYSASEGYGDIVSKVTFANANITVYAVWGYDSNDDDGHHSKYTLYYHSNFGEDVTFYQSSSTWNVTVKEYDDVGRLPERDGYVFVSWNTEPDGSGTRYMPGDPFHIDGSSDNLYAQWQKDKTGPDDSGVSNWLETDEHRAYLTGYPDSTFRADRNMTRAEVAQMFYALLLDKNVTITKSFSDVPDDAWYATAVKTLASLGMMDGYPDGTFRPDEPITRAEFATVGLAFAYDPLDASCSYYDVGANAWYYTYVAQATTYGWIGGYPDNTFRPGNNITRVEVCVIVNNMLGRDADERYIDRNEDELVHFVDLSDSYWGYYTIMESTNTHEYTGSFTNEKWTDVK